jgi:Ni,Fe-hydrogenase III small subunit/ferredoxin-like protein FixX
MSQWVINGLCAGIKSTRYPAKREGAAGISPGLPATCHYPEDKVASVIARCPTSVFNLRDDRLIVDQTRCVHCYRCIRDIEVPVTWQTDYESASVTRGQQKLPRPFQRSTHIIIVDAGDCGACLNEVKQLNNPYYNMHRLGFFITPTPRHADVLLVVGPVTDQMRFALEKVYDAMPTPKRVVAVGACALSGGVFAESFVCAKGVTEVLPVDVEVPGQPPAPLSILHGLLVAVGRKAPKSMVSETRP